MTLDLASLGNTKGSQTLEGSGVRVYEGRGKGTILKPSQTPDPWSRVRGICQGSSKGIDFSNVSI